MYTRQNTAADNKKTSTLSCIHMETRIFKRDDKNIDINPTLINDLRDFFNEKEKDLYK